ncbi:MAG: hypothetical protein INR71_06105, partial [Terriglobus roseus]|nr:hypothetical protein [Terriglobus roseus]
KRIDQNLAIPLGHDFSQPIFSQDLDDSLNVALTCGGCNTAGTLNVDVQADVNIFSSPHVTGSITAVPSGVSATVGLDLVVSGTLTTEFDKSQNFVNVGLPGAIDIPGVATLGPSLMVNLDAKIDSVTAQVDLNLGSVTMSIDDNSKAVIDFNDGSKDQLTGFAPSFSAQGPSISAGISATASLGVDIVLGVDAELFGTGIAAGLALAAPQLQANAALNGNGCGGVEFDAGLSAQLNAFGGFGKVAEVAAENTISIIGTSTQIFSTCLTGIPGTSPTDAPATTIPDASQPTGSFGGTVGSTLSDVGCQNLGASSAASICASFGGDALFTVQCDQAADLCCTGGTACVSSTDGSGVSGTCCF